VRSVVRGLLANENKGSTTLGGLVGEIRGLTGGRNNRLYACRVGDREICVKRYVRDGARRVQHEWAALTVLSALGIDAAPQPLHYEPRPDPALVMTLLAGTPLGGASLNVEQSGRLPRYSTRCTRSSQAG